MKDISFICSVPSGVRALASPDHPRPLSQRVTIGRWDYCGPQQAFCLDERYFHRHKGIGPFFAGLKSSDPAARIFVGGSGAAEPGAAGRIAVRFPLTPGFLFDEAVPRAEATQFCGGATHRPPSQIT
jgi:hypothetical protein